MGNGLINLAIIAIIAIVIIVALVLYNSNSRLKEFNIKAEAPGVNIETKAIYEEQKEKAISVNNSQR
ncbi:hypothetical protein [Wukongibacter sp. M2B1]|uniref:hypothetical protein n=1 Tax=Wukongibacter sp. M2B1 TaxID=3088895 RepID=UPI003D7944D4